MRSFWKCFIVSKTLIRTKLKFYFLWGNWGLIFILGPLSLKSKNPHKFNSLNLLMLNDTILEMPYCQLNFGKKKLENIPFLGDLGADFHIWAHWPKIKKCHKLRYYGLLGVLVPCWVSVTQEEKIMIRNPMFLK